MKRATEAQIADSLHEHEAQVEIPAGDEPDADDPRLQLYRPFGPLIARVRVPSPIVDRVNMQMQKPKPSRHRLGNGYTQPGAAGLPERCGITKPPRWVSIPQITPPSQLYGNIFPDKR